MTISVRASLIAAIGLIWFTGASAQSVDETPPVVPSCLSGQECPLGSVRVDWFDLGSLGGSATVFGINAAGDMVGSAHTRFEEETHAVIWTRSTGIRSLGLGEASDINNLGQVTGYTWFADGARAFVWTEQTGFRDLGTLGGAFSRGLAINDRGWVAGASETSDATTHAFLWTPEEGMIDLGTLGGRHRTAYGINLWGQVVGGSMTADRLTHAFTWTRQAGMVDLGPGFAFDVNRQAWIVGQQLLPDFSARAVAWTPSGMLTLGPGTANAINELGDIAWNNWIATLWSWPLGIINMQVGAADDVNELDVLVGAAVAPAGAEFGLQTGAMWRVQAGWQVEFDAVRRMAEVIGSESPRRLPNRALNGLARAEQALLEDQKDAASAELIKVIRHVERLTRSGRSPEWYVLLGMLRSIVGRLEE